MAAAWATEALPEDWIKEEAKVPPYTLPDPLVATDGTRIADAAAWRAKRRPELLRLFEQHVYGRTPIGRPPAMTWRTLRETSFGHGAGTRREIEIRFFADARPPTLLNHYLPANQPRAPVILGLNFNGNAAVDPDPALPLPRSDAEESRRGQLVPATEKICGAELGRWEIETALRRGAGVATAWCFDMEPDHPSRFAESLRATVAAGQPLAPDAWGAIGAWAWGLSRCLDVLQEQPGVDGARVVVFGHSRLGKAALWAAAQDERFAAAISNDSGAGGAALSRRIFGERTHHLNQRFPHWFCTNHRQYDEKENDCPVDQHELLALVAPRPLLVTSATEDLWADPHGEQLSLFHAGPVYRLHGHEPLATDRPPAPGELLNTRTAYFLRPGKHDVTPADWNAYLQFVAKHVR